MWGDMLIRTQKGSHMRNRMFRKLKQNKAFTLMEMLVTLAMVIALLGIAVVGIADWSKKIKMAELDNYAKVVYLEAQNQLSAMEAEGALLNLSNQLLDEDDEESDLYEKYNGRLLVNNFEQPADYSLEAFGNFWEGLYYFTNDDEITALLVPEFSLTNEYGNYLIEVSLATGDVYGVFFWEDSNEYLSEKTLNEGIETASEKDRAFEIYTKLRGMEVKGEAGNNRQLASRTEYEIGYYGGYGSDDLVTPGYELNQKVEIVNGEELYIKLSYDLNEFLIHQASGTSVSDRFSIDIKIEGETSGAVWTPKLKLTAPIGTSEFIENGMYKEEEGRLITYFLLDSMQADMHTDENVLPEEGAVDENGNPIVRNLTGLRSFAEITKGTGLIPGENLRISVVTRYSYRGINLKEESDVQKTNSLFASVTDETSVELDKGVADRTISVSAVRHLKNLGEAIYSAEVNIEDETIAAQFVDPNIPIVAVKKEKVETDESEEERYEKKYYAVRSYIIELVDNIDFSTGEYLYSKGAPVESIEPIDNKYIFLRGDVESVKVDGNGFVIKNLKIESTAEGQHEDGSSAAGLFKRTKDTYFYQVKMEDCIVKAPENSKFTGGLVGYADGGRIEKSGVYLSPTYIGTNGIKQYYSKLPDDDYGTVMQRHYETMFVTGGNVVGGLVGKADKTYITDSFSAVKVKGVSVVGGLVGFADGGVESNYDYVAQLLNEEIIKPENAVVQAEKVGSLATIVNSYASGDVYALGKGTGVFATPGTTAAGLVAHGKDLVMYHTYATGNVYADDLMAGFIGNTQHCYAQESYSYGEVLLKNGSSEFTNQTAGGYFAYGTGDVASAVHPSTGYLSQVGYNATDKFIDVNSGVKKEYKDLTSKAVTDKGVPTSAHPYDVSLLFKAFPFQGVTNEHYGDWPTQYFINTSLVYYEKYRDDKGRETYGYYSVTKLTDISADPGSEEYVWVLDSLRDDLECVEDGYALLSMFYLESVEYKVYQATGNDKNPTWVVATEDPKTSATPNNLKEIKGTLTTVENAENAGPGNMVNLTQQGALIFNAYKEESTSPYTENYRTKKVESSFVSNGMYMYQLPYELQNTYRKNVSNFYDVIRFYNGFAKGNVPDDYNKTDYTETVNHTSAVIKSEDYYYCPHFPKLAVNPGVDKESIAAGSRFAVLAQPTQVAVRTARHLNNLGRVPYYWNNRGGTTKVITYNQELDINFSSYTKDYCGETYNLLAFDTSYANQPIGQNASLTTGNGAFQNDYEGNYHQIIDYCVKSSNQYVGLFGEIYKPASSLSKQIRNVVMMVSDFDPETQPTYLKENNKAVQNNAGLIICTYQDTTDDGVTDPRVGLGALIGSDYTSGAAFVSDDSNFMNAVSTQVYTVYNCASSGYRVQYHVNEVTDPVKQPKGIAIGGLIGYSRGNVAQSMANNDITLVLGATLSKQTSAVLIGGFSGSSHHGTTLNCYSGGTIDVDVKTKQNGAKHEIDALYIGGFSPGWLYADGVSGQGGTAAVTYINVYSFTTLTDNVTQVKKVNSTNTFNTFVPCVSRMELNYKSNAWQASMNDGYRGCSVPGYAYYMATPRMQAIINNNDSSFREFFEYSDELLGIFGIGKTPKTGDVTTAHLLSNLEWVNWNKDYYGDKSWGQMVTTEVKFITSGIYGSLQKVSEGDYPFPAYVKAGEKLVHYGDWPSNTFAENQVLEQENQNLDYKYGSNKHKYFSSTWHESNYEDYTYYTEFSYATSSSGSSEDLKISCKLPGTNKYIDLNMDNIKVGSSGTGKLVNSVENNDLYYNSGRQGSFELGRTYRLYVKVDNEKVDWVIVLEKK